MLSVQLSMKRIPLTRGKYAIVDDEDYKWLSQWKWYARQNKRWGFYARTNSKYIMGEPRFGIEMHRFIIGAKRGQIVDHINRNTLDNRKENLRFVTYSQNCINAKPRTDGVSKFKGVYSRDKKTYPLHPWVAQIKYKKKTYNLGYFSTEEDAARAYDKKAWELCPKHAYLNFPQDYSRSYSSSSATISSSSSHNPSLFSSRKP